MTTTAALPTTGSAALSTGIRMHYVAQGDPDGEPLVLLHGLSDSSHSFSRLLPYLHPGYRVYALDLRGHGDSDRPADGYDVASLAGDVVAFLDSAGIARASVLGHSLGSLVGRRVAEVAPQRVQRLAMIGAIRTPLNDAARELQPAVRSLDDATVLEFAREFQVSTVHVPTPPEFFDRVVEVSQGMPLRVWRALVDEFVTYDDSTAVAGIAAPTLLLWGEHDSYFGRDEQEWLLATIPNARLQAYADSGHNPHWEIPDRAARDLQAFLGED